MYTSLLTNGDCSEKHGESVKLTQFTLPLFNTKPSTALCLLGSAERGSTQIFHQLTAFEVDYCTCQNRIPGLRYLAGILYDH